MVQESRTRSTSAENFTMPGNPLNAELFADYHVVPGFEYRLQRVEGLLCRRKHGSSVLQALVSLDILPRSLDRAAISNVPAIVSCYRGFTGIARGRVPFVSQQWCSELQVVYRVPPFPVILLISRRNRLQNLAWRIIPCVVNGLKCRLMMV